MMLNPWAVSLCGCGTPPPQCLLPLLVLDKISTRALTQQPPFSAPAGRLSALSHLTFTVPFQGRVSAAGWQRGEVICPGFRGQGWNRDADLVSVAAAHGLPPALR